MALYGIVKLLKVRIMNGLPPDQRINTNNRQNVPFPHKKRGRRTFTALLIVITILFAFIAVPKGLPILFDLLESKEISPIYPAESSIITNSTPRFEWTALRNIESYEIQLSRTFNFEVLLVDEVVNDTSFVMLEPLAENCTYFWRVMPIGNGEGEWSRTWDFFLGHDVFTRTFEWSYGVNYYTITINIPGQEYYEYSMRTRLPNYASYVKSDDSSIRDLAFKLNELAEKAMFTKYRKAEFVLSFVQSLEYLSDQETKGAIEYPRYPVETLVDGGGDCEDTAILFVSLIQTSILKFDGVLLLFEGGPSHMAAGIWCDHSLPGTSYFFNGKYYYYCETTSPGWIIGEVPEDIQGNAPQIINC
ncbi:MAG: hypothetical protein QHH00_04350 [Methanomassiliicoccales archaeon]|nr:hypothetical protein [Methanomassiliicoccales archaeon]